MKELVGSPLLQTCLACMDTNGNVGRNEGGMEDAMRAMRGLFAFRCES